MGGMARAIGGPHQWMCPFPLFLILNGSIMQQRMDTGNRFIGKSRTRRSRLENMENSAQSDKKIPLTSL